jgi:hypothetical protein
MRIEWLREMPQIEALRDSWIALENRVQHRTIYSRFDYVIAWYHCYAHTPMTDYGRPLVGAAWEGNELIGVAPLIEANASFAKVPVRRAVTTGYNLACGEFLLDDSVPQAMNSFVGALVRELGIELVMLNGVDIRSPHYDELRAFLGQRKLRFGCLPYHWFAVARLHNGYSEYARERGYNFRKQTRKIAKRIAGAGEVRLDRVTSLANPGCAFRMRDRMFALAETSWRTQRAGLQAEREHQPLYRELIQRFGEQNALDLSILVLNGRDAAFNLSLVERGICYHSMIGYDPELHDYSPGTFLLQEIFKLLPERGIHTVCSHGGYDYKKRWASEVVSQFTICIFGSGIRATLSHFVGFRVLRGKFLRRGPSETPRALASE